MKSGDILMEAECGFDQMVKLSGLGLSSFQKEEYQARQSCFVPGMVQMENVWDRMTHIQQVKYSPVEGRIMAELEFLRNTQLVGLQVEEVRLRVRLTFVSGTGGPDYILEMGRVAYFKFSKSVEDDSEECLLIGEVNLEIIDVESADKLRELNYLFPFPGYNLFHFHIDGGISVDVFCANYQIFKGVA